MAWVCMANIQRRAGHALAFYFRFRMQEGHKMSVYVVQVDLQPKEDAVDHPIPADDKSPIETAMEQADEAKSPKEFVFALAPADDNATAVGLCLKRAQVAACNCCPGPCSSNQPPIHLFWRAGRRRQAYRGGCHQGNISNAQAYMRRGTNPF